MDDGCEYRIAHAFAPSLLFLTSSTCAQGEPYWAAKYFANAGIVRIAYMPAYYRDCGHPNISPSIFGHAGDAEFIWVEVSYNVVTRHWQFDSMWLSAHFGESYPVLEQLGGFDIDRSAQVSAGATGFHSVYRSHPEIWVASSKHANYNSVESCRQPIPLILDWRDICGNAPYYPIRFPVTESNNVGSRFVGTLCVPSRDIYAGNGVYECFYQNLGFRGWQPNSTSETGYYDHLMSPRFESRGGYWGPGPTPPTPTTPIQVTIDGPTEAPEHAAEACSWTAETTGGSGSISYQWTYDETPVGTGFSWSGDTGTTGFHDLAVTVTDATGSDYDELTIEVSEFAECFQ